MAGASGTGDPSSGVVRNSALSFVETPALAQPVQDTSQEDGGDLNQSERLMPAGLKALCEAYSRLYPDQPNPLQVTTRLKYWLGGQDPLDYISMYWNPGRPEEHIPPHWHYVSFGLSDLHGDGRVHAAPDRVLLAAGAPGPSGTGTELSLRLSAPHAAPPLWPAALLQALARYVLTTGNKLCAGDHVSWHASLDGCAHSRVRHLLVAEDPQLQTMDTPHGTVTVIQLVGCTGRELRAAQRGSGFDVLKLIAEDPNCGGPWLVTRASRRASARRVRAAPVHAAPAQLAGVSARLQWMPWTAHERDDTYVPEPAAAASPQLPPGTEQQIKDTLQRGLSTMSTDRTGQEGHTGMSTDSFEMSSIERALPQIPDLMQGSWRSEDSIEYLDGVHLILNAEAASLLPLAIDGRVSHGRHFTWRCGARAVTVLSPAVAGAVATVTTPYVARGGWLQMVIPKDLVQEMSKQVSILSKLSETDSESDSEGESERDSAVPALPLTLTWPRHKLKVTVVHDLELL